jgi:hypothetical protein
MCRDASALLRARSDAVSRRLPRRPGRPSALTPEVERRLLDAIAAGVPIVHAAVHAGIGPTTFGRWMRRGEEEEARVEEDGGAPDPIEAPYRELWHRVRHARAQVAVQNVSVVQRAAEGGYVLKERTRRYKDPGSGQVVTETETDYAPPEWKASAWLLEKSFHREFGRAAAQVEVIGDGGGPVQVEHGVTPEVADIAAKLAEFAARRQALDGPGVIEGEVAEGERDVS